MSSKGAFTPAPDDIKIAKDLAFVSTIPGTFISFLVLLAYSALACFKQTRTSLNRVSFRLMVYTLVFNVLFGIAYTATPSYPGSLCNFSAFAVNFTLSFATFFTTCIAVNLQLVLVHGINGKRMEKFYIIVTAVLSIALNVPTYVLHEFGDMLVLQPRSQSPFKMDDWDTVILDYILATAVLSVILNVPTYALHQFGYNDDTGTCWYSNEDPATRLKWIIGTQSFWITLGATIETVCSLIVLVWIYRFQRNTEIMAKVIVGNNTSESRLEKMPTVIQEYRPVMIVARDKEYRKVVLRIVMYPIASLIVNYATVVLDLNMTVHNLNTQHDFNLLILDLIFYGIRPLVYGILALTDPAFVKALREIRINRSGRNMQQRRSNTITQINFATISTHGNSQVTDGGLTSSSMTAQNLEEAKFEPRTEGVENRNVKLAEYEELLKFERQL